MKQDCHVLSCFSFFFFFFNDTATTEIYTLSLHDALPISAGGRASTAGAAPGGKGMASVGRGGQGHQGDRKSTRLNSSHGYISYAVFCLKKKKTFKNHRIRLRIAISACSSSVVTNCAELHR